MATDVDGEKERQQQEIIRRSETSLRILRFSFDRATVGIYRIASDSKIMEVNETAARMTGYTEEELTCLSVPDIDIQVTEKEWGAIWQGLIGHGGHHAIETIHQRKDGSAIPVAIQYHLLEYDDRPYAIAFVQDITEKKQAMDSLAKREQELDERTRLLEKANTALKAALEHREAEIRSVEADLVKSLKRHIVPYIDDLNRCDVNGEARAFLTIIETNLNDILSRFSRTIISKYIDFTPTEIRVADLIRNGKDTNAIAQLLNLSPTSVHWHRKNIRKKLGLKNKKINLYSYLKSF
jgi:PAS domain S-box-containing protein